MVEVVTKEGNGKAVIHHYTDSTQISMKLPIKIWIGKLVRETN